MYRVNGAPRGADTDTDGDGGQRRCACGERCADATIVRDNDGTYRREPVPSPRPFCETDRMNIVRCLRWLPERYLELSMRLGDRRPADGLKVSGGAATPPVPIRLDVDALMVQTVNIVASWDERVRDVARLADLAGPDIPERRGTRSAGIALTRMCATLTAHLDALLALPAGPMLRYVTLHQAAELAAAGDAVGLVHPHAGYAEVRQDLDGAAAGLEILALGRRCRSALGWTPKHEHLPVPCRQCGLRDVWRWDGDAGFEDRAECLECREVYEGERYTLLMGEVAQLQAAKTRKAAS
jgi:hypothetical protein